MEYKSLDSSIQSFCFVFTPRRVRSVSVCLNGRVNEVALSELDNIATEPFVKSNRYGDWDVLELELIFSQEFTLNFQVRIPQNFFN